MQETQESYIPKLGKCGLKNIGNTCYMNSILQLLFHCKPLISFLMKKNKLDIDNITEISVSDYEHYLEKASLENAAKEERKRLKIAPDALVSVRREQLEKFKSDSITSEIAKLIDTFINKGASVITPGSFKMALDKKISNFRGFSQHDAHELIIHILDTIIEETGIQTNPSINNVPKEIFEYINYISEVKKQLAETTINEEKKKIIEQVNEMKKKYFPIITKYEGLKYMIKIYTEKYNPFIYQIQTILVHKLVCPHCNNITSNYEHSPVLQLQVEDTLSNCFEQLTKQEVVENYDCKVCNEKRTINKYCKIWRTPSVLFIQLKRFEVFPNGRVRKDNTYVDIPISLDLSEYCDESMETSKKINRKYKLRGFSNHIGSLNGGHYTADCVCLIDNKTWYHFDDSIVSRNTNRVIDISNAYILLYELE